MKTLREARAAKGWSQINTAKKLGVHVLTYQLWERNAGKPCPKNHAKLVEVFGGDIEELRQKA